VRGVALRIALLGRFVCAVACGVAPERRKPAAWCLRAWFCVVFGIG